MSAYSKTVFGTFTDAEQTVRLRYSHHLVGAVIDRFGKDIMIIASDPDPEHFTVNVERLSPEGMRGEMRQLAESAASLY